MSYKNDYNFGKEQEEKIIDILEDKFKDNLKHVTNKYSKYDYEGDTYKYELKSRNCRLLSYPTTLLPADKILKNEKQIFIFNFTDKIGYIKYNKKQFNKYEKKPFIRNWRVGGHITLKNYYYIPVKDLKIIYNV
jgi:putative lipase involved disintegration of autophagic bodies